MAVLGVASNGTDSAGCIVSDGRLVCAAEEERFSRVKGDGSFPVNAIRWCLESTGLGAADIEHIAVSWNYDRYAPTSSAQNAVVGHYRALAESGIRVDWARLGQHVAKYQPTRFHEELRMAFPRLGSRPVMFFNHHDSHAASSFFFSEFDRSLILVMDEKGEDACLSLYLGIGNQLRLLKRRKVPHSLGLYYASATEYLGLRPFRDEGTFMALASHGEVEPQILQFLTETVLPADALGLPTMSPDLISGRVFDYERNMGLYTAKMEEALTGLGVDRRAPSASFTDRHKNFACAVQRRLEDIVSGFVATYIREQQLDALCVAGGVALNCKLNGRLALIDTIGGEPIRFFAPPWCGDAGGALGAAILNPSTRRTERSVAQFRPSIETVALGPEYSAEEITVALRASGVTFRISDDPAADAVARLANGEVVGWFQGRAEFGPRALGQRSIVCDPRLVSAVGVLNARIKRRHEFQPMAPSILLEEAHRYFGSLRAEARFMATAFLRNDARSRKYQRQLIAPI